MGAGELLNCMFEFSEKLSALQLNEEEMSLFSAVVLVSAGMPFKNIETQQKKQQKLIQN